MTNLQQHGCWSVRYIDEDLFTVSCCRGARHGPDRLGGTASPAYHAANIVRCHLEAEPHGLAFAPAGLHPDRIGLVDDLAGHILQDGSRRATRDAVERVAHLPLPAAGSLLGATA